MRRFYFVLWICVILLFRAPTLACTCNIPPPACFEYGRTEAVFIGTVKKVNPMLETSAIPFESVELSVDESFKGVTSHRLTTFNYGHSCAFNFQAGESYLFYGEVDETKRDEFGTNLCHRTARLKEDLADLEFLRTVKKDQPVYWAWGTISEWGFDSPLEVVRAEVLC